MTDDKKGRRPTSRTPARLEDALTRAEAERAAPGLAEIKRHRQAVTEHKRTPNAGGGERTRAPPYCQRSPGRGSPRRERC
jgi:hypothetical protein